MRVLNGKKCIERLESEGEVPPHTGFCMEKISGITCEGDGGGPVFRASDRRGQEIILARTHLKWSMQWRPQI